MATPPIAPTKEELRWVVSMYEKCSYSLKGTAERMNKSRSWVRARLNLAEAQGMIRLSKALKPEEELRLIAKERDDLKREAKNLRRAALTDDQVRREIIGLAQAPVRIPDWCLDIPKSPTGLLGVPTLMLSDVHDGEVVDPTQIGGQNAYDMDICEARLKRLTERTIDVLGNHWAGGDPRKAYPGLVLAMGGDMVTGEIHEELKATNDDKILPCCLHLQGILTRMLREFADYFGQVFCPCVIGNHGRGTDKVWCKDSVKTSFDWLIYMLTAQRFEDDPRVKFLIPNSIEARYQVYGHRYLLTHGNQFKGGDGIIGSIGPVFRGDTRKRSGAATLGRPYDTLVIGHFHQTRFDRRVIQSGSTIGMNEYSEFKMLPPEPPQHACWLTHPKRGITYKTEIHCEDPGERVDAAWVSWPEEVA